MKMAAPDTSSTKSSGKRTSLTFRLFGFSDIVSSLKSWRNGQVENLEEDCTEISEND
jgi:hypothetical protein